jgi:hypothetical protein
LKAYFGSRNSPNMTKTPEGFLICHNVPIARTGWQEYLGQEIGLPDAYDQKIQVYRDPEEVFSPATMASFEGKPVTDGHPTEDVTPANIGSYMRGVVSNVRQGKDNEAEMLLADLVIHDAVLISEIEHDKREVSCGYDCTYEPLGEEGKYQQKQIRGNHVAVVMNGRAGSRVAIKDEKFNLRRENSNMSKPDKKSVFGRMFAAFVKDATPEEIAAATEMAADLKDTPVPAPAPTPSPAPAAAPKDEGATGIAELTQKVDAVTAGLAQLTQIVNQLVQTDKQVHAQADPLDALDAELAAAEKGEGAKAGKEGESSTIEDQAPIAAPEDTPKNPIPGADSAAAIRAAIKAVKPIIAGITDPAERKKAADSLVEAFRDQMGTPASAAPDGYKAALNARNAAPKAKDAKPTDDRELGREWAKKYNPHYKEGGK